MKVFKTALVNLIAALILLCQAVSSFAELNFEQAENVWRRVAEPTGLMNLPFYIKKERVPNAWVKNGSSVTVTTGLLRLLDSESELYGVFAHEAGHIKLKHYRKTINRRAGLSIAASVIGIALGSSAAQTAANVGAKLANAGWSREQEIEADDYSVELAFEHGEDPVGMYLAIKKLSSVSKTQPSGFNSHPPDNRRMLHIKNKILSLIPDAEIPE